MKKSIVIALVSFSLGLIAAGVILLRGPDKKGPETVVFNPTPDAAPRALYAAYASMPPETRGDLDFVGIAEKVGPAVVKIEAEKVEKIRGFGFEEEFPFDDFWNRFFGQPRQREQEYRSTAQGTGFFISPDGYLLTNYHIVENAVKVEVTALQGETYTAKIVGTDPKTDIALLKIEAKDLPFAEMGDSASLKVGEWVLAIGNPFGLEHTVTAGIVSAKGRQLGLGGNVPEYQDFIQTDTAINRGNSGGPLVNMRGEVVGITSNILAPAGGNIGLGFAIPSNLAKKVVVQLREKGRVVRGKIGITMPTTPLTEEDKEAYKLKDRRGALVTSVEPGAPADKAGIKPYDVIVAVDGERIKDPNDLKLKIADIEPGKKVNITVVRDGKEQTFVVTVEELEPQEKQAKTEDSEKDLGFTVRELTPNIVRRYGLKTEEGLIITQVRRYSEAERKGLAVGDIIVEVNKRKVATVDELDRILKKMNSGEVIILLIRRESGGDSFDRIVTLRIP